MERAEKKKRQENTHQQPVHHLVKHKLTTEFQAYILLINRFTNLIKSLHFWRVCWRSTELWAISIFHRTTKPSFQIYSVLILVYQAMIHCTLFQCVTVCLFQTAHHGLFSHKCVIMNGGHCSVSTVTKMSLQTHQNSSAMHKWWQLFTRYLESQVLTQIQHIYATQTSAQLAQCSLQLPE